MLELHQLIKSLDANEKKYFKRFGLKDGSKGKTGTERLFEIMEDLEVYDEEKITNRLKRAQLTKQAVYLKSYLYNLLLDTLLWYNKEKSGELRTTFELSKIKLLEDRGLDKAALKLTEKLMSSTLQHGSFTDKWNALGRNIHFASNEYLSNQKSAFTDINGLLHQRNLLLSQMARYHEYDALLAKQLKLMRKAMQARNEEDLKHLKAIFENEIVQQAGFANSRASHFIFFTIRLHHFQLTNQLNKFFAEAKEAVAYIKKQGTENFPAMQILWVYAQLTQACYFTQQWQALERYLQELKDLETTNTTEKTAQFTYYTQLAITLYDYKQDKKLLHLTLNEAISNLMLFKNRLRADIRLSITLTCVSALVEYGHYSRAVDLCEDFLTNYDTGIRLDALLMLYVYEFICHLEMGNTLYINNTIQNVYRYFLRHDYKGAFESKLMHVFKKISEIQDYPAHRKEIEKLKAELNEAGENAANHQHLALMPLVQTFLDAKLVNEKIHVFLAAQKQKG